MKNNDGQSLVEMLVAVAVVVIVVLGLVLVTTVSLQNARFSKDQALASKYAQEGVERVRAFRDQSDWATFTTGCQNPPGLLSPPSPFVRTVVCSGSGDTRNVTVKVEWSDQKGTHKSELTTGLTNWK